MHQLANADIEQAEKAMKALVALLHAVLRSIYMAEDMLALQRQTEMNQTELLKAVIARIQADVLQNRDQEVIQTSQRLVRLAL
ncbi:hypothetical protein [Pseudomonas sp. Kh13]|uniref:hypothetical protein n=1 Tax=Pseudomonas sp. Kh13 TaxID=2093744 RepID=UPI0011844ACE|nr:hypothetical protein [Pseudomonas sp. Kh13]